MLEVRITSLHKSDHVLFGYAILLSMIDGDVSDANTKVCGDGHAPFSTLVCVFLELEQTSDNTGGAMKKQIRRIHSIFCWPGPLLGYFSQVFKHSTRTLSQPLLSRQFLKC